MSLRENLIDKKETIIGLLMALLVILLITFICGLITVGVYIGSTIYGFSVREAVRNSYMFFPFNISLVTWGVLKLLKIIQVYIQRSD